MLLIFLTMGRMPSVVLKDVIFLVLFALLCYVVAVALQKPLSGYAKRVAEKATLYAS